MRTSAVDEGNGPSIYSVGDVLAGLRGLLEERVGRLWVLGEVSNLRRPGSGHLYFTLKDDEGQLRAALFRGTARQLAFEPEDGLEVLVYGEISVYPQRGDLQIIVRHLEPRGEGALRLAFEQLRRRLEAEGLFEPGRKRALPAFPARIGVVTSAAGAALRDVLQVTGRRHPGIPIRVAPTRVQGAGAELEVAEALEALALWGDVSLILLVRGGGSLEDLQPFNSETLARAIARSPVPVCCGVGHEVDVTIADLVADVRAPTPSAAAELAVPHREAARGELAAAWRHLRRAMAGRVSSGHARLDRELGALRVLAPSARLAEQRRRWLAAARALSRAGRARVDADCARLGALAARLDALSPLAVLGRGYALVRRSQDGAIVRSEADAPAGERISIRLARAELEARVEVSRPRREEPNIL